MDNYIRTLNLVPVIHFPRFVYFIFEWRCYNDHEIHKEEYHF
jgi:hypothetical protein